MKLTLSMTSTVFIASTLFLTCPVRATVLSAVEVHFVSGPMSLGVGQTATSCAVNPDSSPIAVLIALLTADTSSLLASQQLILQPGTQVCVSSTRQQGVAANVYAVVVPNGRLEGNNARIVQDRPGGGSCIMGSLQIQAPTLNNTPGQTILYGQMIKHVHSHEQ